MEAWLDPVGNRSGPVAKGGWWRGARESQGEEQADAARASEVEVLSDHGLEEVAALDGTVEDLGQTDFDVAEGEAMVVAGRAFGGRHRPGQPMRPAVEERLNVGGTERIAGGLERGGVGAGEEAVVETFKANAIAAQALLHPLMAVQTQLHRIRQIRADFEKRRPPVSILHVEVIVVDGHRLPREVEHGRPAVA